MNTVVERFLVKCLWDPQSHCYKLPVYTLLVFQSSFFLTQIKMHQYHPDLTLIISSFYLWWDLQTKNDVYFSSSHNGLYVYTGQERNRPRNIPNQQGKLQNKLDDQKPKRGDFTNNEIQMTDKRTRYLMMK